MAAPAPMAAPALKTMQPSLSQTRVAAPAPHVRSWFPEALYINPEIITDGNGVASITIPMADSITTWRMAMLASTEHGALGTGTSSLKVFQDFFVDLDLPVTLTQGDRVSIPVAVYNYSGERGDVSLKLNLTTGSPSRTTLPTRTSPSTPTVSAARNSPSKRSASANSSSRSSAGMKGTANRADIVIREIEVVPNGREQNTVFNGRLEAAHGSLSSTTSTSPIALSPTPARSTSASIPARSARSSKAWTASCACPTAASSRPRPPPIPTSSRSTT